MNTGNWRRAAVEFGQKPSSRPSCRRNPLLHPLSSDCRVTIKRFSFLLLGIAGLLVLWWKCSSTRYVNFPPTASGPWVAFGDSLTEGYGASEGNNYPALLGNRLKITIINKGKIGDTTADGLQRLDEVLQLQPRVVLLCLGGNDSLNQESKKQTFANLAAIIDRLQMIEKNALVVTERNGSSLFSVEKHQEPEAPLGAPCL